MEGGFLDRELGKWDRGELSEWSFFSTRDVRENLVEVGAERKK